MLGDDPVPQSGAPGRISLDIGVEKTVWSHQAKALSQQGRPGAWGWACAARPAPAPQSPASAAASGVTALCF